MSMRPYVMGALGLLLFLGLSPGASAQSCTDCHEIGAAFASNRHLAGKAVDGAIPNAVCESCHGNGAAHIEGGGDTTKIVKPAGRAGADVCASCHKVTDRKTHAGMHANTETVNCLTCHSVHKADAKAGHLLVKPELALCSSCHTAQAASLRNKPYGHRVGHGMECSSCHEPHGSAGWGSVKQTAAGEPACVNCHAEKREPMAFEHGAKFVGGCMACHEQHGSNNPKQLKRATVYQLCLECHSPMSGETLGAQPPAFHNLSLTRYQNCLGCHVAIHGSNRSPHLLK